MNQKIEQFKQDAKYLEEDNKYIHDKLIALTTAIMGFTIVMLGDGKLKQINECLLKISWLFFGGYILFSLSILWASLRHKVIVTSRGAMIALDEEELKHEPDPEKRKEKAVLLQLLRNREFFLHGFKKQDDPYVVATKAIYKKYINELNVTKYLKNPKDFDSLEWKDRLMIFCTYNAEWSYVLFVLGMISLLASVLF